MMTHISDAGNQRLPKEKLKIVRQIEAYGARYDPNSGLTFEDQLLACEAIAESTPPESTYPPQKETNKKVVVEGVNGMSNGARRHIVNFELPSNKQAAINELKKCGYRTPPVKVSQLLEMFFEDPFTFQGHWLFIAQTWTPVAINRTLHEMVKSQSTGFKTIQKPAAYFTKAIRFRKKRRR